jgi:hypothetical protein
MEKHKALAIRALENLRGDDTARAERAFRGMTPEQMQAEHGQSGRTRAAILAEYRAHDAEVDAALAWLRTL